MNFVAGNIFIFPENLPLISASHDELLTLYCIRGVPWYPTFVFVFFGSRILAHLNAAIFLVDDFCNCLNSSCVSFGEKIIEIGRVVFDLISINWHEVQEKK